MSGASLGPLRAVLGNRDLRLLLGAGVISQTGDWMLATGIGFQVYALTGSTLASAAALFATQLPQVLLSSPAGVLVDRWENRRVLLLGNLLLAAILLPLVAVQDASQLWIVIAVVALSSCITPFTQTAQVTLLPSLVPEEQLVTANAANAQVQNIARLVGAGAGGVIVATLGFGWLVVIDAVSFVVAALLIMAVRRRSRPVGGGALSIRRDWIHGVRAIRGNRVLLVILIFFAVSGLGEAVMGTLFAPFVIETLGAPPPAFGAIMSAQAVGGIVGGALVTAFGHRFSPKALVGWGAVAFGLGDLALFLYPLLAPTPWPAMIIIALVGVPGAALFAGVLTLFQSGTDAAVRGRVYGVFTTVQNLIMLAVTFAAGALAVPFGIVPVISIQGAAYLAIGVLVLIALRHRRDPRPDDSAATRVDAVDAVDQLDNPATSTMLPNMALASNVRTHTVSDPVAMRALAHPLRIELLRLVAREGSLTAADAARQLGVSHALASHHLRQLAKYGFIEPAEATDRKERPWRVVATSMSLERDRPESRVAAHALDRQTAQRATDQLVDWQDHRAAEQPEWSDLSGAGESILYLTPDELAELQRAWSAAITPWAERRPIGHAESRPADAVPVSITVITTPLRPTERGG